MSVALKETRSTVPRSDDSTEEIRQCFPALARNHNGYPGCLFRRARRHPGAKDSGGAMTIIFTATTPIRIGLTPTSAENRRDHRLCPKRLADFLMQAPTEVVFGGQHDEH